MTALADLPIITWAVILAIVLMLNELNVRRMRARALQHPIAA